MSIVVFWISTDEQGQDQPCAEAFADAGLSAALQAAEARRREGCRHVCISSELQGAVGKAGVAAVENGQTPDGQRYDWSKAHRAGRMRRRG